MSQTPVDQPVIKITTAQEVQLLQLPEQTLDFLQSHVGDHNGLVDVLRLLNDLDMWVPDSGLDTEPTNEVATAVAEELFGAQLVPELHGDAVIARVEDGATVPLRENDLTEILRLLKSFGDYSSRDAGGQR